MQFFWYMLTERHEDIQETEEPKEKTYGQTAKKRDVEKEQYEDEKSDGAYDPYWVNRC